MILLCIEWRKPEIVEVAGIMMIFLVVLSRSNNISTKRQQKPVLGLMRPRDLWVKLSILICFYLPFWSSFLCTLTGFWLLLCVLCSICDSVGSFLLFLSLWQAKVRMLHQGAFSFLTDFLKKKHTIAKQLCDVCFSLHEWSESAANRWWQSRRDLCVYAVSMSIH